MSHLGRPNGVPDPAYTLEPVAARLTELLGQPVAFVPACYGDAVKQAVRRASEGSVVLLENLRFHPEEEANDAAFAGKIARSTDARYFVQDGFGVVHRAHASTSAIANFLPGVAGLLLEREISLISQAMDNPKRPFYAVMGGAKVSDKIKVIEALVAHADKLLIGGAMANTFLAYKGYSVGKSLYEVDQHDTLDAIYAAVRRKVGQGHEDEFILLPTDVAVRKKGATDEPRREVNADMIAADDEVVDIGGDTIERYAAELDKAKTVIWNGTMGLAENPAYAHGSARVALALASDSSKVSIIGGGDTADFALKWDGGSGESFTHVSTGGGASLDLMAGKPLPGVQALLLRKK